MKICFALLVLCEDTAYLCTIQMFFKVFSIFSSVAQKILLKKSENT